MMLEEKKLHWYFNLGGETAKVAMTEDIQPAVTNYYILLER